MKHSYGNIAVATDQYPFGLAMEGRKLERKYWRYGYQGEYSEKDEETKWNAFQLRQFDPVIGRWTSTDPYGQYPSPYLGMGNNPVSGVDPDGGLTRYTDEEGNTIANINDGSNAVVVVSDMNIDQFLANYNMADPSISNSTGWNNYWTSELGGAITTT